MNEPYIQALRDMIKKTHGCVSRYVQTVRVKEEANGATVFEGDVEIFDLAGHGQARQCYAWAYKDADGRRQLVSVLKMPGVDSAALAVRGFFVGLKK